MLYNYPASTILDLHFHILSFLGLDVFWPWLFEASGRTVETDLTVPGKPSFPDRFASLTPISLHGTTEISRLIT